MGLITREICRELVDEWVTVTDEEICRAILFLLEGEKTVAEGAGAAGNCNGMNHLPRDLLVVIASRSGSISFSVQV